MFPRCPVISPISPSSISSLSFVFFFFLSISMHHSGYNYNRHFVVVPLVLLVGNLANQYLNGLEDR
jgi:hypothetical protein